MAKLPLAHPRSPFARRGGAAPRAPRVAIVILLAGAGGWPACHRSVLPPRPDGAAVVLSPEILDDGLAAEPETEPNDTISTAQRLTPSATTPVAVAGRLEKTAPGARRDIDCFRIDLPDADGGPAASGPPPDGAAARPAPRTLLRADVRPEAGLAVILDALDAAGRVLVSAPGQPGEPIAIPNLAIAPGPTTLRLRAVGADVGPGGYRLVVHLAALDVGAEIEPNGSAALATELLPGSEAVGYLGWRHDQDWYRLPTGGLAEGSVLSVDLDPVAGVGAALQLIAADGHKLTEARGRKGERVVLRDVRFSPGDPQVFLVVRADADWSADARYNVRPRADLPRPGSEAEPNDDVEHAQTIGDGTVSGYLGRGDTDVFRYTTEAPAALEVELAPPEHTSVRMELLRADGTLLARAEGGRRGPLRISNQAIPGGPIFVRLAAGRGSANPDDPYRLSVTSHPVAEVATHDTPRQTPAEAPKVTAPKEE